mgnify:CR=1 FL=1
MPLDQDVLEKALGKIEQSLNEQLPKTQKVADDALKEAKSAGELSAETKAAADAALTKLNTLTQQHADLMTKLDTQSDEITELAQKLVANQPNSQPRQSVGKIVTEHDRFKQFLDSGASGSVKIDVQQAITSADGSAGDLIWSDREEDDIVRLPRRQMTIRQLLSSGTTDSNSIEYAKQISRTNNADVVAEGAQKPESDYVWDKATANVRTIAHLLPLTRQALDDAKMLQTEVNSEMGYGIDLAEEQQLLAGDGTGENLLGLIPSATAYSAPTTVGSEQQMDRLRLAMLQLSLAEYAADGVVLHPTDWATIELLKDGDGNYMVGNPKGSLGPSLWSLPVVPTQAISANTWLVGHFKLAGTIYDRMGLEILISSENKDNFEKNMLTMRAEKRLALAVKRPAALVTGNFTFS